MSATPPARCAPKVIANKPDGPLVRVWDSPCQIYFLRNDGAVGVADGEHYYTFEGEPPKPIAALQRTMSSTVAGSVSSALLTFADGRRLLAFDRGTRCERLPVPPVNDQIVGTGDGRMFYWGYPDAMAGPSRTAGLQLVERARDGSWHISPAIRAGANASMWAQNGRVVFGYQSSYPDELGYFDPDAQQLKPIRRASQASGLQLVPGSVAGEPLSAMYTDDKGRAIVDIPDPAEGYRQITRELAHRACPGGGMPDPKRRQTGRFETRNNPILLRTSGGGLWLAYTDVRGRCTYTYQERGYLGQRDPAPSREERELIARPPPPPPAWRIDQVPEQAHLVLVPVERGRFGAEKRIALPVRHYLYTGPWQYHPSATASRIRIAIGGTLIDLDPAKLGNTPALATPWLAGAATATGSKTIVILSTPANAPPLPALRATTVAPLAITYGVQRKVEAPRPPHAIPSSCLVLTRSAQSIVDRQLVLQCGYARAVELAVGGGRAAFRQFSQQGNDPLVEIDATGDVRLEPRPPGTSEKAFRFVGGKFVFESKLPRGAPPVKSPYHLVATDGTTVFGATYESGNALMRGTITPSQYGPVWVWNPAFGGGRTPPTGGMFQPVFLHRASGDPTIVFSSDPRVVGDITVRLPDSRYVSLPTWGKGIPSNYRVHGIVALARPGAALPVVAAKIDESLVVGTPDGKGGLTARSIAGSERFPDLTAIPPGGAESPARTPHGPRCSETLAVRDREELYSPQLFPWGQTTGLAYLSTRIREQLRFTVVAPKCGWVLDGTTRRPELVLARVDERGATEVVRIPVEYRGGSGIDGANLLIDLEGSLLHTLATNDGTTTYTRIVLPP